MVHQQTRAVCGIDVGDRADLQIEAGLLLDAMKGAETAQEIQVHRAPHPLHRSQGTGHSNPQGGVDGIGSISSEAWKIPPQGDRQAVGAQEGIRHAGNVDSKG